MAFMRSGGVRVLLAAVGLLGVAGIGAALGFYLAFIRDLPDLKSVQDYRPPLASRVYARDGRMIGEFFAERRTLTPLDSLPAHVINAFVASEDSTFFEHSGIDLVSIVRAAWVNLLAGGEIRQGGSTITQQMVKGLLLSPERNYRRKIREMILARDIEKHLTKQEILYLYLNQIYFGHGAHGVGEAARTYFGKDVVDLSVSEAALVAGLPKAPSHYSPRTNPARAEQRRRYVLDRMLEEGFIDAETFEAAVIERPRLAEPTYLEDFAAAAYFTEEVRRYLFDELGSDATLRGGLRVETTLDLDLQHAAVAAVRKGLVDLSRRQGYRGPLRHVEPAEIPAEIERLARENGLLPDDEDDAGDAGPGAEPPDAGQAAPIGPEPLTLAGDRPFLGVVTAVDTKAQTARVGFAPGLERTVRLDEVSWAREPDPERSPYKVRSIASVFEKGDVARFTTLPPDPERGDEELLSLVQEPLVEGALLSIDLESQEVLALVGGYDFERSQFDRVTQARRQPGSAFKPIIYGAALSRGYTPASIVHDRPVVYVDEESGFTWRPRNYKRAFYGPITLRTALARSVNNATVHLFRDVGVDYVIDYARRLGIESPLERDLSLALGSSGVSLLELTRAYAVFGAKGRRVVPIYIRRVTDADGEVLIENATLGHTLTNLEAGSDEDLEPGEANGEEAALDVAAAPEEEVSDSEPVQVLSPAEAYLVADLLRAVVVDSDGTGWRLRDLHRPVAGKTGTTNDQGDAWFIGFSPDVATGVWVGHDESRFLGWGETGSRAAAPIWVDYMRAALAKRRVRDFEVPEPIVFARIDRKTGLLADSASTDTVFQAFLVDTVPTESATKAQTTSEGRRLLRMDAF